ncbi:hypothetical protein [Pelobacter propionicus]|uniref:Uncharacterized protein n=1 Tax=Pelobacter propionicus (strain DSM 2379 / NBRC 103807 / OttBd1) TaxID=338966 RepID=A1ANQ9_PELPD|nr:hypothetical protein [Pelobacter propionicus]ABK98979.1 hypothetical protein Ppro_1362 [Pelobacter propionicus DSM 2379]
MVLNTPRQLRMIEQAMKDRAPGMYQELKESGMLQRVLEDHNEAMVEAFLEEADALASVVMNKQYSSHTEYEQALTLAGNTAWERAMATWLEFEDTEEQKLAYINGSPEIQRRLERAYQKWMDGVDPEHREEFQEFWDCEQKQTELNWILEELSRDDC